MKSIEVKSLPLADLNLPTTWWGDVALFSVSDCVALLNYCDKVGIAVLGVEGFRLEQGRRIPEMECIADFSSLADGASFCERSIEAMKRFTPLIPPDVFLEFVLATP